MRALCFSEFMLNTVARYSFPHEAHIARAKLESEGIPALVADEHTINMQWLYSNALGGVRLQVPAAVYEQAKEILALDCSDDLVSAVGDSPNTCPSCGSTEITFYVKGRVMAYLVFILTHFPFLPFRRKIICKNCGVMNEHKT